MDVVFNNTKKKWKILLNQLKNENSYHYQYLDKNIKELLDNNIDFFPKLNLIQKPLTISPRKIKLIIVGEEPYINSNSDGLAFSSPEYPQRSTKILLKLFKETISDSNINLNNGNLNYLFKQGVLLLNYFWIVKNKSLDCKYMGWGYLTTKIISYLSLNYKNLVFILFGKYAELLNFKIENNEDHFIIIRDHPNNMESNSNITISFDEINNYIYKYHNVKINFNNK